MEVYGKLGEKYGRVKGFGKLEEGNSGLEKEMEEKGIGG